MFNFLFAHAGEVHESTAEATAHEISWFIQLPLFLLAVAGFSAIIYLITKKRDTTALITSFALLVTGFGIFQVAPVISATAITLGLVATLLTTLVGLGTETTPTKKAKK